jgi:type III secretion system low calcium response chaperone LcrH/SycD
MKSDRNQVKKGTEDLGAKISKEPVGKGLEKNYNKVAQNLIQKGFIPKDAMGLSDQMVEGIYGQAYRLYQTGRYNDASQLFRLLIMINSTEPKYAFGLAACFHMMKEYKNAAETYSICALIEPDSPVPHYHASDCYLQMKDNISALIALELAVKRAGQKPEFKALKDRAQLTIESLKKELAQAIQASAGPVEGTKKIP